MGTFSAKLRVWNPSAPERVEEIQAMVDTGAAFSWIHRERLERLGVEHLRRIGFRAIDGSIIERETVAVWVGSNGFRAPDIVVMAEPSDMEVIGVHTIEGLGLAADPVQKKLIPTVMPALTASTRQGRVATAIDAALASRKLVEPFSNEDFRRACPGFGGGTYQAFLWKHRKGNGHTTELFELIAPNQFKRIHA
jgi:aspartyl protease family protein